MFTSEPAISTRTVASVAVTPNAGGLACGIHGRSLIPSGTWFSLARMLRLSSREMQIVQNVFDDRKLDSIAFELGISPHTVDTYFHRLYTKLHVSSRPQLILRVMAGYLALVASGGRPMVPVTGARVTGEDLT